MGYSNIQPKKQITPDQLNELNHTLNKKNRLNPKSKALKSDLESNEEKYNQSLNSGMTMLSNSLLLLKLIDIPLDQAITLLIEKDKAETSTKKEQG